MHIHADCIRLSKPVIVHSGFLTSLVDYGAIELSWMSLNYHIELQRPVVFVVMLAYNNSLIYLFNFLLLNFTLFNLP